MMDNQRMEHRRSLTITLMAFKAVSCQYRTLKTAIRKNMNRDGSIGKREIVN